MHNAHNYTSAYCTIYKKKFTQTFKISQNVHKVEFFKNPRLKAQD